MAAGVGDTTMRTDDDRSSPSDVDERFRALLEGLRTALPGSTVLLAFLLSFPLQAGFGELNRVNRGAFLVAVVATSLATVFLIAPSAQALARFPASGLRRQTPRHVEVAAYLALLGAALLAVGLAAAMFLSVNLLAGRMWGGLVAGALGFVAFVSWFGLPIVWTLRGD